MHLIPPGLAMASIYHAATGGHDMVIECSLSEEIRAAAQCNAQLRELAHAHNDHRHEVNNSPLLGLIVCCAVLWALAAVQVP